MAFARPDALGEGLAFGRVDRSRTQALHRLLRVAVGDSSAIVRGEDPPDDGEEDGVGGRDEVVEGEEVGVRQGDRGVLLHER